MNKRSQHLIPLILVSAAGLVHAADPVVPVRNNALEDTRDNLREIRNIEDGLREDAAWSLHKSQEQQKNNVINTPEKVETPQLGTKEQCLQDKKLTLEGVTLLNIEKIRKKLPNCVSEQSLNQLSRDIIAEYISKGYINTQIDFIEQGSNLIVKVKEARIREITGASKTVNIKTLFPNYKDKSLNIHDLDQGIEQANKLNSNKISMDIYPHDDGTVSVGLVNDSKEKKWFGSVSVDNRGSRNHRAVVRTQIGIDSPLGLSDSLYIGGSTNIRHDDGHYSRGGNIFYTVPYGAWTLSAYGSQSRSQSITTFASGIHFAYRTKSDAAGLKAERVLMRNQSNIVSAYGGVDYLNTKAVYGGSKLALQSPRLGTFQAGLSYSRMLKTGIWINDLNIEVGTRAFGAKDTANSPFTSRFTKYSLQSNLYQSHWLGSWLIRNQHQLSAQYSKKDLYSTKQFSVSSNVRGFKELSLDGNSGVSIRNNLLARRQSTTGLFFEPYVGGDWGFVKDGKNYYRGTGVALGINIGYKQRWQFSLESAQGFFRAKDKNKANEKNVTASFRVSF